MLFGHIVSMETPIIRRIGIIQTATGEKYYYLLPQDVLPLPDGAFVSFETAEVATNVTVEELPSTAGKEVLMGQLAMETWKEQTAEQRAGIVPNPLAANQDSQNQD